jgi:uncharacterized DUF497 family protein
MLKFDWDPRKDKANQKKHGVSFEEAQSVFFDDYATQFDDEEHSGQEERFILLGMSIKSRVLVVCHYERKSGSVIRLISARKATAGENMKSEYDFSKMNSRKNPYASKLKKQVTIRMGQDVISYFKAMSEDTGIPYRA